MFNRTVEFKVTKPNKTLGENALSNTEYIDRLNQWREVTESVVSDVAKLVAGYMILDTFRKATIAKAAKVCCQCKHL